MGPRRYVQFGTHRDDDEDRPPAVDLPGGVIYSFGDFEFDPTSGDLTHGAESRRLQKQPSMLLHALLGRGGDVLTRQEIRDLLWPDSKVEYDQGINFSVRKIREALGVGDDGRDSIVETLPRRGYRIVVPVRERRTSVDEPPPPVEARGRVLLGVGVIALVSMILVAVLAGGGDDASSPLVAVLPHLTPDDAAPVGDLADRIAEALVSHLFFAAASDSSRAVPPWRVAGPSATRQILGSDRPTDAARDRLGACYTISGTLRQGPDSTVVLFTQLIRTTDDAHLWAAHDTVRHPPGHAAASRWATEIASVLEGSSLADAAACREVIRTHEGLTSPQDQT